MEVSILNADQVGNGQGTYLGCRKHGFRSYFCLRRPSVITRMGYLRQDCLEVPSKNSVPVKNPVPAV